MVICQYFLKGTCKFGDRCRNEHRKADNTGSYNQGGRNQRNFQQGSHGYNGGHRYGESGGRNTGDGRYDKSAGYDSRGYGGSYNQGSKKNYQQGRGNFSGGHREGGGYRDDGRGRGYDGGHGGYHNGSNERGYGGSHGGYRNGSNERGYGGSHDGYRNGSNERGYGGSHDGYRDGSNERGYGGSHGGFHDGSNEQGYSRDRYHYDARDKNRFAALAHQTDPEPPSFQGNRPERGRTHSTTSQHSIPLDQKADRIRKDMREWEESGQWPLSSYAPFVNEPCLDGFVDISPEEMRSEAYKANIDGNAAAYAQSLQQTLQRQKHRKQELSTMSSSTLQDELSRSSQPSAEVPGGLFGNLTESSIFQSMSTSSGLLGPSPQSMHTLETFPSNPSAPFATSSTPFGSTQANNTPSSTSMFGQTQGHLSGTKTSTDGPSPTATMTSLRCSEEDLKAFRAEYFVMGAIPECPPPLELC